MDDNDEVETIRAVADWIEREYPEDYGAQASVVDLRRLADEVEEMQRRRRRLANGASG